MSQRSRIKIPAPWPYSLPLLAAAIFVVTSCEKPSPTETALVGDTAALAAAQPLGGPLPFLTPDERSLFERGSIVFQTDFTPATGLGPLFNNTACSQCHEAPVVGGVGEEVETHATAFHEGVCNDLSDKGGPVIEDSVTPALHAALGIDRAPVPPEATAIGHRTTPSILGFGLLDAVPDAVILAHADPDDRNHDGIRGRPNRTPDGRIGRFGRKAQVATLREFTAGAFLMEMGITNPSFPTEKTIGGDPLPAGVDPTPDPELPQQDLDATDAFVRLLAPPPPLQLPPGAERGGGLFRQLGCADCHLPELPTGADPTRALAHRAVQAYTDLLLHDMGPALADICLGLAGPSDFRTEPLMGLRFKEAFLHDGRATTIEQAIELHAGEATGARERFLALSAKERAVLLEFLGSL